MTACVGVGASSARAAGGALTSTYSVFLVQPVTYLTARPNCSEVTITQALTSLAAAALQRSNKSLVDETRSAEKPFLLDVLTLLTLFHRPGKGYT